jgi:F-type H+-transporting ATPase subunit b
MNLDLSQIIAQIIAFLVTLWILKRFGWKPLLGILDERQKKIQAEFDAIAAQKIEAQHLIDAYQDKLKEIEEESRDKIQEAVEQGRQIAAEIKKDAQANAEEILAKADAEIQHKIAKAQNQLNEDLVTMVIMTTERILQEKLDRPMHEKLIADFVAKAEFK